ncbi:MAG: rRNA maturation RNase YbeY [Anaerolinea sp.]|nr:rRNA maturation RNase YbeY [Anaerolinea sp.]
MIFLDIDPDLPSRCCAKLSPPPDLLEQTAQAALTQQAISTDADLTLVLTGDSQVRELNREFLGIDAATDVLSFPAGETDPETGRLYLGDILISVPRAESQAQSAGHTLEAELQLLVVHGVLHLLGHDHAGVEEKARMWAAQAEILEGIGLASIKILE